MIKVNEDGGMMMAGTPQKVISELALVFGAVMEAMDTESIECKKIVACSAFNAFFNMAFFGNLGQERFTSDEGIVLTNKFTKVWVETILQAFGKESEND